MYYNFDQYLYVRNPTLQHPLGTASFLRDEWVGGGGKLTRVGKVGLPINAQLQAFYNAETPEFGPIGS